MLPGFNYILIIALVFLVFWLWTSPQEATTEGYSTEGNPGQAGSSYVPGKPLSDHGVWTHLPAYVHDYARAYQGQREQSANPDKYHQIGYVQSKSNPKVRLDLYAYEVNKEEFHYYLKDYDGRKIKLDVTHALYARDCIIIPTKEHLGPYVVHLNQPESHLNYNLPKAYEDMF